MTRESDATTHWSVYRTNSAADNDARGMAEAFRRLGFDDDVCIWFVKQGLKRPDKLAKQTDDSIDRYVQTCRKPGGGQNGHTCPMDAVELLKLAAFGGRHMDRIDRYFSPTAITEEWCTSWQDQVDLEKNWEDKVSPDEYPKAESAKSPAKMFEALETLFGRMRGVTGIPLLYVVRKDLEPPDEDRDPTVGESDSPYLTHDDEMIARAPIILDRDRCVGEIEQWDVTGPFNNTYLQDRKKVWVVLHTIFNGTYLYVHMKKFRQQNNGRGAYFALKEFLLGKDHVSRMVREMEASLKGFVYRGEGRRYGFAKYRTNHVEQHDIAESLVEFGYPGLSQDQKVTYFLDGIKTSALDVAKATVRANAHLKSEFDACATYIQDAINAAPPAIEASGQGGTGRGVSQVGTGQRGGKAWTQAEVDAAIPALRAKYVRGGNRFYIPTKAYKTLTTIEKQAAYQIRKSIGGPASTGGAAKGGGGGEAPPTNRTIKALTASVNALTKLTTKDEDSTGSDSDKSVPKRMTSNDDATAGTKRSNANHPALVRPEKRQKN